MSSKTNSASRTALITIISRVESGFELYPLASTAAEAAVEGLVKSRTTERKKMCSREIRDITIYYNIIVERCHNNSGKHYVRDA